MKVHFIAIGGSAMHNLAIALHRKGYKITGSDDEIFDPSKSRLEKYGLLPKQFGWFPEKIRANLDAVILGMHAHADNPELAKAKELGLRIYSYPEYLYEQSKDKVRIVIGGSHGKTTITSMILHVLNKLQINCDYMVGAQLEGFEVMVKLSESAKYIVLEGDEYLTSPIDRRPKFHLYRPNIALLSGIAWDHINVFPTFENYVEQFDIFCHTILENGSLVYFSGDENVKMVSESAPDMIKKIPYEHSNYKIEQGKTIIINRSGKEYPLQVFGKHNLQNIEGAKYVCAELGISEHDFYTSIQSFKGASKRLQLVYEAKGFAMYKDFAHSPSKLKATVAAVKEQFSGWEIVACMELHTYSSLNKKFLNEYKGCMDLADKAFVYFNPHTIELKRLEKLSTVDVAKAFGSGNVQVFSQSKEMVSVLQSMNWNNKVLLMMSSGNFDGVNLDELIDTFSFDV